MSAVSPTSIGALRAELTAALSEAARQTDRAERFKASGESQRGLVQDLTTVLRNRNAELAEARKDIEDRVEAEQSLTKWVDELAGHLRLHGCACPEWQERIGPTPTEPAIGRSEYEGPAQS